MPTSKRDVAHFLRRAGYGGLPGEIEELQNHDRGDLVDAVMNAATPPLDAPGFVNGDADKWETNGDLIHWWLDRMATSTAPFAEKLTFFWHGHFTSSLEKAELSPMWKQHMLFREKGLGSFRDLCQEVAVGPAMLEYLDNSRNGVEERNENFARELMELFTLGHGNYTQDDVVASARAWTGHGTDDDGMVYKFRPEAHDNGMKKFLGVTKNWDGPDIIDALTSGQPGSVTAKRIAKQMWTYFAYPDPEDKIVDALAKTFVNSDMNIKTLARAIFMRDEFWGDKSRQGHVRGPVEFVVAATRYSGVPIKVTEPQWQLGLMGQKPFWPPSVAGWPGDKLWITNASIWFKGRFAQSLTWAEGHKDLLEGTKTKSARDAAAFALGTFGMDEVSRTTMDAITRGVEAERAAKSWAEREHLIVWAVLAPEFQVA